MVIPRLPFSVILRVNSSANGFPSRVQLFGIDISSFGTPSAWSDYLLRYLLGIFRGSPGSPMPIIARSGAANGCATRIIIRHSRPGPGRFAGLDQAGRTLFMFLPGFSPFAGLATGFLMLGRVDSSYSLLVSNGPCEIGSVPRSCGVQGTLMTHCERTCCSTCFPPVHSLMHRGLTNPT